MIGNLVIGNLVSVIGENLPMCVVVRHLTKLGRIQVGCSLCDDRVESRK